MPDQPADPLHYEMKIPPEKHTSDTGKDSDQPRPENRGSCFRVCGIRTHTFILATKVLW
jgi:hypothetical protein